MHVSHTTDFLLLFELLYIYIPTYMYVCVCVCVCVSYDIKYIHIYTSQEVAGISEAAGSIDETGELTIRASAKTREITASYVKDEAVLEACP